ncbi:MAG: TetR/AcrR family transcriptional regulator [Mycobacteriales bacterium]|nr:TetR/AcrR family transcriptional regulator [Frankia sp.]
MPTRAGNTMARTRASILAATSRCLLRFGTRKTTMGDIAREAGVAKATLYNHFRSRDEVYAALVGAEVDELLIRADVGFTAGRGVPGGAGSPDAMAAVFADCARAVTDHRVVRRLADSEPGVVAELLRPGSEAWAGAREHLTERLLEAQVAGAVHPRRAAGDAAELVMRWVLSHAMWPASADVEDAAAVLARGLVAAPAADATAQSVAPAPSAGATVIDVRDVG